jgi:hypothetical protein
MAIKYKIERQWECPACHTPWTEHDGLSLTCLRAQRLQRAIETIYKLTRLNRYTKGDMNESDTEAIAEICKRVLANKESEND